MVYYAIADCNNFYASCERAFQPKLEGIPIVVLSNNDGCVIARSQEAKDLGIPMGAKQWEYRAFFKKHQVKVCSSNYQLYGDMSERVMTLLESFCDEIEVYSIDEAFLKFRFYKKTEADLNAYCKKIRDYVYQCTGLPISIGLAPTKTLAKLANHIAKKQTQTGVFSLAIPQHVQLKSIGISEVWGIGRALKHRLNEMDIYTIQELQQVPEKWMRQQFGVVGLRTLEELKGKVRHDLEPPLSTRKHLMVSRSFRKDVFKLEQLQEAIAVYATRVGEKLRQYDLVAEHLTVYLWLNPFRPVRRSRKRTCSVLSMKLPLASHNTNDLIAYASRLMKSLFVKGYNYKKAGVMVGDLRPASALQTQLFLDASTNLRARRVQKVMDQLNQRLGKNTLFYAACGDFKKHTWSRKAEWESPKYTTRWKDLLRISAQS